MNWFQRLVNYICKAIRKEIPFEIKSDELLIRGIVHPMFYSDRKKTIRPEAFLPPPNRNDVSVLRHLYTTDDFCKVHSSSIVIGDSQYCGLASFQAHHVGELNNQPPQANAIKAEVKATPMDENSNYIKERPVFTKTPGLPMHADMLYETPTVKGEPQTRHRQYASRLAKISNYFHDPSPMSNNWKGKKLTWKDANIGKE